MKDYLENSLEVYKITLKTVELSKEELIQYTFEIFNHLICAAEMEEKK